MSASSLLDTVLARTKRSEELDAERDDEFQTWVRRLNAESMMLLKQIDQFDYTDSADREAFYALVDKSASRFESLRNRDEIGEVPVSVTVELDQLLDRFEDASQKRVVRLSAGDSKQEQKKDRETQQRERDGSDPVGGTDQPAPRGLRRSPGRQITPLVGRMLAYGSKTQIVDRILISVCQGFS